jgi:starch phosphorylase
MEYEGAIRAVTDACAYTSHAGARAAMAWPAAYMEEIVPALMPVIRELDRRVRDRFEDPDLWIIDPEGGIHIDRLQIHYCSHVDGVGSSACTDGYRKFREIYPERFCFIANGISFRRWLTTSNRELAAFISAMIGDGYKRNPLLLEDLLAYRDDPETLAALEEIKYHARQELCRFLLERTGRKISPDAVFDMQIKPLQEDRRQLMNVLDVIHRYLRIRRGDLPSRPAVFFITAGEILTTDFARDLLHLMRVLQEVIDRDEKAAPYMKLVVISGCNVTWAEKLIPACDISEQIALASREACGTVNMKCMLNGAVTIGTDDGSNAMIRDLVGTDRTYLFGHRAEEIAALTEAGTYSPSRIYGQSETVREAVDFILSPDLLEIGDRYVLQRLYDRLTGTDPAMDLLDLEDYIRTRDRILADYEDRERWQRMMLVNIARAGGFSSDNTAEAYNERIWGLKREVRSRDWF